MRRAKQAGFTLIELLVVIAIAALITAITLPVAFTMTNGNKAMTCASRLQQIGNAIRQYTLDNGTAPPRYVDLTAGALAGPGFDALYDGGYIRDTSTFHCPADRTHPLGDVAYTASYSGLDSKAAYASSGNAYGNWNRYKYLSCRGVLESSTDTQKANQLTPLVATNLPSFSRDWYPSDKTIVTWCDYHVDKIQKGGQGIYEVLYWDGSVRRIPAIFMRAGTATRTDAWRVEPGDDPTP
jgi:prepilin-type N-terminal cleavage/methylation domain-containing protein